MSRLDYFLLFVLIMAIFVGSYLAVVDTREECHPCPEHPPWPCYLCKPLGGFGGAQICTPHPCALADPEWK